jgi:hypothetical protein
VVDQPGRGYIYRRYLLLAWVGIQGVIEDILGFRQLQVFPRFVLVIDSFLFIISFASSFCPPV